MNIAIHADAPFGNEQAFMDFIGANYISHVGIVRVISEAGGIVQSWPLDGDPMQNKSWMFDHWQTHASIGRFLGIYTPELADYDLTDEPDFKEWMALHASIHENINLNLGITS